MRKKTKQIKVSNDYVARQFLSAFVYHPHDYDQFMSYRSAAVGLLSQGKMSESRICAISSRFSEPQRVLFGKTLERFGAQTLIDMSAGRGEPYEKLSFNRMFVIPVGGPPKGLERLLTDRYGDLARLLRETGFSGESSRVMVLPHIFRPQDIPIFAAQTLYDISALASEILIWGVDDDQRAGLVEDMIEHMRSDDRAAGNVQGSTFIQGFLIGFSASIETAEEKHVPDGIDMLIGRFPRDAESEKINDQRFDAMDEAWADRIRTMCEGEPSIIIEGPMSFDDLRGHLLDSFIEMKLGAASGGKMQRDEALYLKVDKDGVDVAATRDKEFLTRFHLPHGLIIPLGSEYFDELALRYKVFWGDETAVMPAPSVIH